MNKRAFLQKLLAASILIVCASFCCAAQIGFRDTVLQAPVSPRTEVTYLELLRKVFPDVQMDEKQAKLARAKNKIPLRNLFGQELPEIYNSQMLGELQVGITGKMETISGRDKILWLLIGVSGKNEQESCFVCGNMLLAAYRIRKTDADLIDAASVKTAGLTAFAATPKLSVAPRRAAVVVYNEEQVNIATSTYSIVAVGEKGFDVLLKEFDENRISKCGYYINEESRFRLLKKSVGGYRQIEITVKTESGMDDTADSETIDQRGFFRYVFSWQPRTRQYRAAINPERARKAFFKKHRPCMD